MNVLLKGSRGSIGRRHQANLRALGIEPTTCDISLEGGPDSDYINDFPQELYEDALVLICTPTGCHADDLGYALAAGAKSVFVEKPLYKHGLTTFYSHYAERVICGYCYRFHPAIIALKSYRPTFSAFYAGDDLLSRYGPTALSTMASHSIDAALWVSGLAEKWWVEDRGETCSLQIKHKSGAVSQIHTNINAPRRDSEVVFEFKGGNGSMTIGRDDDMYVKELQAFLNYAETGEIGDLCGLEEALAVQEIIND